MLAGVGLVCVVAILFVSGAFGGLFDDTRKPAAPGIFTPPRSQLVWPTKIAECENEGWRNYVQFASEEECKDYVEGSP